MIRAMLLLKVKPGKEQDIEDFWKNSIEYLNTWPGFTHHYFMRDANEPSNYILSSDWTSKEEFDEFFRVIHEKGLSQPLREARETSQIIIYDLIHDWSAGKA